jgi:hypothetical protein
MCNKIKSKKYHTVFTNAGSCMKLEVCVGLFFWNCVVFFAFNFITHVHLVEFNTENSSSPNVNFSMFGSTIDIVKVLNGIEQQIRLDLLLVAFIQCEEICWKYITHAGHTHNSWVYWHVWFYTR